MNPLKLSICIPTYNFGAFIGEALSSVVPQMDRDSEIVVLDGGSEDSTREVVQRFIANGAKINYVYQEKRGGIDRDMAACVALAKGEYCWLFSADDVMRPGAMLTVLEEIKGALDVYLFMHAMCSLGMRYESVRPVMKSSAICQHDLSDAAQRVRYFRSAQTTEAFFSFLGTIVFRKSVWDRVPINERFIGSCWAHVARLLEIRPFVRFVPSVVADRRGDNDSFADRGIINRYRIAIAGYHEIGSFYFGEKSEEAFHIRRAIRWEFGLRQFLAAKISAAEVPTQESTKRLVELFRRTYCDTPFRRLILLGIFKITPARPYALFRKAVRTALRKKS